MGIVDLARRAMRTVFPGRVQNVAAPPPPPRPAETATTTRIRGIEFDESLITSTAPSSSLPAVVMAFLDGRRVSGNVYNFSSSRDVCQFIPLVGKRDSPAEQIDFRKLKAIFFLREQNNPALVNSNLSTATLSQPGRRLEVVFSDNERLRGTTTGYTPDRLGFFLIPHDPTGKILRVFVINANTKHVAWL